MLRIQTLGGLRVWLDEEPLSLPASRQARALLAILACSARPSARASLCEQLWENTSDPRAALRWCLSRIRPALDAGGMTRLSADGDLLGFDSRDCDVDARRLRALAASAGRAATQDLEAAALGWSGPFLADLELPDAFRFENWKAAESRELDRARAAVFAELLNRHAEAPESRLRIAHAWAQQDPLESRPHAAILEALTALGRRREALAHYERCARLLGRDGSRIPEDVEKARAAIGRLGGAAEGKQDPVDFPAARPAGNPPGSRKPRLAPLAGRREEMLRFAALLEQSEKHPDGKLRLLRGEPGIGKTRLLEEMDAELAERGWLRLRGRAFEAERTRAFGPWIDAARALELERPGLPPCPLLAAAPEGEADPSARFEAMREWLLALSRQAPLALLLDDLHWLDSASVALLQTLLRAPQSPFRFAAAALRSVAAPPDAAADPFLRFLQREGGAETWDIGPLGAEAVAELMRQTGSRRDPAEVFALGAGHPLASLALAEGGGATGAQASLEAMLDERVLSAGDAGREVLQWASLLGRGLPIALLETLLDMPVMALLGALEKLESGGLMRVEESGDYLFGHDLIRQRVQEGLSAPRRKRMHVHVAQALKRHPPLRRGWEEVALHAEQGEQWELAAEACLEAGNHCFRLRAMEAAESLAMRGLDHLDRMGDGHWTRYMELCMLANQILVCMNRLPDGFEERLKNLARRSREKGQNDVTLVALGTLATVHYVQERPADLREAALQISLEAETLADPESRAYSLSDMAACLIVTDQELPRARQLVQEAARICSAHGLQEAITRLCQGWLAQHDGRIAEARSLLARAVELIRTRNLPAFEHQGLCALARLELEEEDPLEVLRCAEAMKPMEPYLQHAADRHFAEALEALAHGLMGDPSADQACDAVLEKLRACQCKVMTSFVLLFRAERDLRGGILEGIPAACHEALERCEPLKRLAEPTWARCLIGLAALRRGDLEAARAAWEEIAPLLRAPDLLPARVFRLAEELALGVQATAAEAA